VGRRIVVRQSEFDAWVTRFHVTGEPAVDALVADMLKGL
jgi:hypothetical protein